MFQKLKDKFAEEVKQSALKFPVSVQQITQAVSSSTSPNKSVNSESIKEDESEDILNESTSVSDFNSEFDSSFTTIDLRSPTPNRNRRSSTSSDLFPIYEFQPTRHNLQSDLESNSEFDDGSSIHQFTNVSKEILYEKYRNMLQKYHKYRGRFVDMRKYCLELEREHDKIKNVLTETQDKAIRRTKELKEQCALEQTAKAHLEEVLRNELEDRDLIISTLNTKIKLLKNGKDNISFDEASKSSLDFSKSQTGCDEVYFSNSSQEVELLKDKIKYFELLLSKAKEAITTKNNHMRILESKIESSKHELKASNEQIAQLQNKIDLMKHKEEEALLSLAENKMIVHRELEAKEKHIKILEDKLNGYENEMQNKTKGETDAISNLEKLSSEEIRAKDAEIQSLKNELLHLKAAGHANVSGEILTELDQLNGFSRTDVEDSQKNVAEIDEYLHQIEDYKSQFLKKQEELKAKDVEIIHLTQVKTRLENDIASLQADIFRIKAELSDQSQIRDEISTLNKSLCQMRDALNEKDQQMKSQLEIIGKLRSELSAVNTKLTESSKYQKMYEEAMNNSKADKIIADEIMKNAKNELNTNQEELKNAKIAIDKYESQLKTKDQIAEEKVKLEQQLVEYKNNLTVVTESLEHAKKVEHEMHVQTANFLEEINKLKLKESEYLSDIRKLKDDISSFERLNGEANVMIEDRQQQYQKLLAVNEAVKLENAIFKEKIDDLHSCVTQLEQSFFAKKKCLEDEQKLFEAERRRHTSLMDDLNKLAEENASLKSENAIVIKSNEEIGEKFDKLFEKNRALQNELELMKENKLSVTLQIEELKHLCQIDSSEESTILSTVFEKLEEYIKEINVIRKDNEILKTEIANTRILAEEIKNWRHKYEMLNLEKEKLEEKLCDESRKVNDMLSQHSQIQNELESHKKLEEENKRKIFDLEEKVASFAQISEPSCHDGDIQNVNELMNLAVEDCSKISVPNLKMSTEKIPSLPASCRNAIISVHSQLLDLKAKNKEVKSDLLHFSKLSTDLFADEELSLAHLMNVVEDCGINNESIRQEVLLLRKEKEELLREVQNLKKEIEKVKTDATENLRKRESFYKEKYSQEMMEIVTGYEKRLAEKDNEYELLQNKMNLRNDRENTAIYQETKEVIQNLQEELTTRQDSYSDLLAKHKKEVEELHQKIHDLKEQYAIDLRENDKRWRLCLDKKMDEAEEKYKEEIDELTKEWTIDRKRSRVSSEVNSKDSEELLENTVKQSEDSETLRKQIQILTNELNNCKRSHWREIDLNLMNTSYENAQHSNLSLEDCTEMEYLRNILFKYMMGHQPLILAKVLAAVVKFDNQQTEQILLREEQKQTLMGHLGLT